jgi:hypothetical protein
VSAPLPARRWISPTVSGRQTSVRTTGWRGRRTRDCGPMCACSTATAAPRSMTIARAGETASSSTNSSRRAVVVASAARPAKGPARALARSCAADARGATGCRDGRGKLAGRRSITVDAREAAIPGSSVRVIRSSLLCRSP